MHNRLRCFTLVLLSLIYHEHVVAQTNHALTARSDFLSPVGIAQAYGVLERSGISTERYDRLRQYFLIRNAQGRWQPAKDIDLHSPDSERVLVDPVERRVSLYIDHKESEPSLPWCSIASPQERTRLGYTACTSSLFRPHPSQRNTSGERLMIVDNAALEEALDESKLGVFMDDEIVAEREARTRERERRAVEAIEFRRALRPGVDTNLGMVIEVKLPLVKIQSPNLAIGERWYRVEEVFPPR